MSLSETHPRLAKFISSVGKKVSRAKELLSPKRKSSFHPHAHNGTIRNTPDVASLAETHPKLAQYVKKQSSHRNHRKPNDLPTSTSFPSVSVVPGQIAPPRMAKRRRKDAHIEDSPWRPPVVAADRLMAWSTPFAEEYKKTMAQLPPSDATRLFEAMLASLDESTRCCYAAGLLRFTQWCDHPSRRIPEEDRMPASERLISLFISAHVGYVQPTTINNWTAGLRFWHIINGAQWVMGDMLKQVKKGASKLAPADGKRPKRLPVTIEHLYALRSCLDLENPFHAALWAVACIAFWSVCRLGELVVTSILEYKHVTRSAPLHISKTPKGIPFATLHIPWDKVNTNQGADISITARPGDPTCPFNALINHLRVNFNVPMNAPFFAYQTSPNTYSWLERESFMNHCNEIWEKFGLPDVSGHCFRIGGATHLLLLGHPPELVQAQGRWKSASAFMGYWREVEVILPIFLSSTNGGSRVNDMMEAMSGWRKKWKV
jgi:hypothetical protein